MSRLPQCLITNAAFDRAVNVCDVARMLAFKDDLPRISIKRRHEALVAMSKCGSVPAITMLLECSDARRGNSEALLEASTAGHLESVQLLAPLCDPQINQSQAIRAASRMGHPHVVDYLLPWSNRADMEMTLWHALQSISLAGHLDQRKGNHEPRLPMMKAMARQLVPHADVVEVMKMCLKKEGAKELVSLDAAVAQVWSEGGFEQVLPSPSTWKEHLPLTYIQWQAEKLHEAIPVVSVLSSVRSPRL